MQVCYLVRQEPLEVRIFLVRSDYVGGEGVGVWRR